MKKKIVASALFLFLAACMMFFLAYKFYPKETKGVAYQTIITTCSIFAKTEPYIETTKGVHPLLNKKVDEMLHDLRKEGLDVRVISGFRSFERQKGLYEQGRTTKGGIVTNAIPGLSYHNYGWAVDVVVYENGKPKWNNKHWQRIGEIGKSKGLVWGGDWTRLVDRPHFQLSIKDILL